MSELAGVCREQLALNNDAVKHRHTYASAPCDFIRRGRCSHGDGVPLCAVSSVAAMLHVLHLWLFSFLFTFSLAPALLQLLAPSRAKQAPDAGWCLFVVFLSFPRMPAGIGAATAYNTLLSQTLSFVINSCLHLWWAHGLGSDGEPSLCALLNDESTWWGL